MDNIDISTSGKNKTPISTNSIEVYNKKTLGDEIRRLTIANAQLITNKIKIKKAKVNLKTDKTQLFDEKNSLVAKRKKLRTEIATLNTTGPSNISIRRHQDPLLRPTRDKLKAKRPLPFDSSKENFQKFFIKIRYY